MTSVWAASGGIIALLAVGPTPIYSAPTNSAVLYVLDADETPTSPHSHVYVISSPDGHVIKTYEIGASAQIALAPDGTKLYVSSHISNDAGNTPVPYLDVYDTATGVLVHRTENPDALQFTTPIHAAKLALSASGMWLYLVEDHISAQTISPYVTAYDTIHNTFLPSRVPLYGCVSPIVVPTAQDLVIDLACPNSTYVRHVTIGRVPGATQRNVIPIPEEMTTPPWAVMFLRADGELGLIGANGALISVDTSSNKVVRKGVTQPPGKTRIQHALVAKTLGTMYFGGNTDEEEFWGFNQIIAADVNTGATNGILPMDPPFFGLALSRDESTLFAASPKGKLISLVDAYTLKVTGTLAGMLKAPILTIPAP